MWLQRHTDVTAQEREIKFSTWQKKRKKKSQETEQNFSSKKITLILNRGDILKFKSFIRRQEQIDEG